MAAKKEIGYGIIGAGFMGRTYAETIKKGVRGAKLIAVSGGTRGPKLAKDYGVAHVANYHDLISRKGVDAVIVATPHHRHAEEACAAADAGKHVLIEKPMAATLEACDRILESVERHRVKCSIGFSQRTRTCNRVAKELLDSGKFGKVIHIRTTQLVPDGMGKLPKWQMGSENKGTLLGHGIHNFDMIRWLTGQEIVTVFAKCRSLEPAVETEGTSDVLMTLGDGTVAYFLSSFQVPAPGFPNSQFSVSIACEKGLIEIDAYGKLKTSIEGKPWRTRAVQPPIDWGGKGFLDPVRLETYTAHLQDFTDSIRDDRRPAIVGWDGRQAVAAALAAYESSRLGKEIYLQA